MVLDRIRTQGRAARWWDIVPVAVFWWRTCRRPELPSTALVTKNKFHEKPMLTFRVNSKSCLMFSFRLIFMSVLLGSKKLSLLVIRRHGRVIRILLSWNLVYNLGLDPFSYWELVAFKQIGRYLISSDNELRVGRWQSTETKRQGGSKEEVGGNYIAENKIRSLWRFNISFILLSTIVDEKLDI